MEAVILLSCTNCGDQACQALWSIMTGWFCSLSHLPPLPLANSLPTTFVSLKVNIYSFPTGSDFYGFNTFGISDIIAQVISARVNNFDKLCYILFVSAISHDVVMLVQPQGYLCMHITISLVWRCYGSVMFLTCLYSCRFRVYYLFAPLNSFSAQSLEKVPNGNTAFCQCSG